MEFVSKAVADYFNKRLSRCFYNYKAIKGFLGMIITTLYQYISVDELIHFDLPPFGSISPHRLRPLPVGVIAF